MLSSEGKDFTLFTTQKFFEEIRTNYECQNIAEVWERLIEWVTLTLQFRNYMTGEYRRYIDLFATNKEVTKPFAIFVTHNVDDDRWVYEDDKGRMKSVQSWVRSQDGKFACIACYVCNPACVTVKAKQSLLLLPDRTVGGMEQHFDTGELVQMSLMHPKEGEISSYTLDYHIKQLETK